jgi:hypothetical protein
MQARWKSMPPLVAVFLLLTSNIACAADNDWASTAGACGAPYGPFHHCVEEHAGISTPEAVARAGNELVRLTVWDAWHHLTGVISFERSRRGTVMTVVTANNSKVLPRSVSQRFWRDAVHAAEVYHHQAIYPPYKPKPATGSIQTICVHADGPMRTAEVVIGGRLERFSGGDSASDDDCFDPMDQFDETLWRLADQAVPACSSLHAVHRQNRVLNCALLAGQLSDAVAIQNQITKVAEATWSKKDVGSVSREILAADVVLTIAGREAVIGSDNSSVSLAAYVGDGDKVLIPSVTSAQSNGATTSGFVMWAQTKKNSMVRFAASYRQTWRRDEDKTWRVVSWDIAPQIELPQTIY